MVVSISTANPASGRQSTIVIPVALGARVVIPSALSFLDKKLAFDAGYKLLFKAVANGDINRVAGILKEFPQIDINHIYHVQTKTGRHEKLQSQETILMIAAKTSNEPFINDLFTLGHGIDVNLVVTSKTALHYAAQHLNYGAVVALMKNGADAAIQTAKGDTALHIAARAPNPFRWKPENYFAVDIAKALMGAGPLEFNQQNEEGRTALHEAVLRTRSSGVGLVTKLIMSDRIDVNLQSKQGYSALHLACRSYAAPTVVELLLNHTSINVNLQDEDGNTPLHYAAYYDFGGGNEGTGAPVVTMLLGHHADPNLQNKEGDNASRLAEWKQHPTIVQLQ